MQTATRDLTQGDIKKSLRSIAIPAAIGFLFHTFYNVTDTYFAGLISTQALAALSLSFPIFLLLLSIAIGMSEALTAMVSNKIGEKNFTQASNIAKNAILFALILSFVVTLFGLFTNEFFMTLLGAEGAYLQTTLDYIDTVIYGSIFFVCTMFLNSLLQAQGDMISFRNILVVSTVLNILFDYILVKMGYGVQGIAYATMATEALSMFYLIYRLLKTPLLHTTFNFELKIYTKLFTQGIAPTANMMFMALGIFIITYYASEFGEEVVAAMGIGMRIEQLALMPLVGLSSAVLTIIAQNSGAKKYDRIHEVIKSSIVYSVVISVIGFVALIFSPEVFLYIFTSDAKVIHEGVIFLEVEAFLIFPFAIIFIYVALLQAIERPKFIFYVSLVRQIIFPIILLEMLMYFSHNVLFVWLGIGVSVILSSILIWRYGVKELIEIEKLH